MSSPSRLRGALCFVLVLSIVAVCGVLVTPTSAQAQSALPFDRSYLVTGNYAVVGVDLLPQASDCSTWAPGCYAKGNITVTTCPTTNPAPGSCIPDGAEVLAAFMYWEAISADPTAIPAARLGGVSVTQARRNDLPLPSQGSCLSSSGNQLTVSMLRADVLRFFPFQNDSSGKSTGRRQVTGIYEVALPEIGNGNNARQGAGASLFFIYRVPTQDLRKIVVYDGVYLESIGAGMQQQLQGFYQSWDAKKTAWLTHVVGSGARNQTERLKFNDAPTATDVIVTDPFPFPLGGAGGNGSDRSWANPTYDVSGKMSQTTTLSGFGETASTAVDHLNSSPYECLTWAAVIFSTTIKDVDHDGLPDGLEDAVSGLKDPNPRDPLNAPPVGRSLPNLNAMKADSSHKDVFIEINGMKTAGATYGHADAPFSTILGIPSVTDSVGHNHLPTPQALQLFGDALKDGPESITAHFDVGNVGTYKGRPGYNSGIADKYLVCMHAADGSCIESSAEARGGETIEETNCDAAMPGCHFPHFPGTVGWKFGFEHYRDQAVDAVAGSELSAAQADDCYEDGTYSAGGSLHPCRRRFDPIRGGLFHYFLYAHALGIPKGKPCLDVSDPLNKKDADFNSTTGGQGSCASPLENNPNFHVPRSTSGAGDAPGGNALITLGLWDLVNFVASPFIQASTSFHELGHNFDLSHGGKPPVWGNATTATSFEANCKPSYPSIMSYLFQVNGLMDLDGNARIDYSRGAYYDTANGIGNEVLNESLLHDGALALPDVSQSAAFRYRAAWYVPIIAPAGGAPGNLAYTLGVPEATRYCNGAKFVGSNPHMGRVDGPISALLLDWNLDGSISSAAQDVNFDGADNGVYAGHNDWAALRLDQIGAGKNPGGFSLGQGGFEFGQGGFEFGQGGFEFGQGGFDYGQGGFEFGQGGFEFGQGGFEFGQGGFDYGDGGFNLGQGGFEFGQGGFEFGQGGFDYGQGGFDYGNDVDFDLVKKLGATPPLAAKACVIQATGNCTVTPPAAPTPYPLHRHRITWNAPNVGTVSEFRIYRALGATIAAASAVMQVCDADPLTAFPVCPSGSSTSFVDTEELPYNQSFTYFVRAVFNNCNAAIEVCQSGPSNLATIAVTENAAPVAVNDGGTAFTTTVSTDLTVATLGVLANDTDVDSPSAPGTLRTVTVTVGPAHGSVVLNANGSLTYTPVKNYIGTDTFSYTVNDGTWRNTGIAMSAVSANAGVVTITITKKK
jgi:hypothetical protein